MKLPGNLPDVLHVADGDVRVKGHRVSLYHIVTDANEKWMGPEALVFHFTSLSLDKIEAVLAYYESNRGEVDEYVREWKAEAERLERTLPKGPSMTELLARLTAEDREDFFRRWPSARRVHDVARPEAG